MKGLTVDGLMSDPSFLFVAFGKVAKARGVSRADLLKVPDSERLRLMRAYAEDVVDRLAGKRA